MSQASSSPDLDGLPDGLAGLVMRHWRSFADSGQQLPSGLERDLARVWAGSDYVAEQMCRSPELVRWLGEPGRLETRLSAGGLRRELGEALAGCADEGSLQSALRRFRHRHQCRIIWRDLAGLASCQTTLAELSLMAEVIVDETLSVLHARACARDGTPTGPDGEPVQMVVLAMGKLGAGELNLSSDIDLVFAYEEEGQTRGGSRDVSNHQFFLRLGQQLIRALDQPTADGFVFRVDMRLRPWGRSGALATGFDAMETYYETQGREWERYALIKMRPVAGDLEAGARLCQRLAPFVYRRYIDYGVFESLREMKRMIEREVRRKGTQDNVKTGPGGIREVEFVVQAFQLIRGGQEPALRDPHLLRVLPRLAELGLLEAPVVRELQDAYVFLRNVEHRLQALQDRQTQRLPADDTGWLRLAWSMGYPDRARFEHDLDRIRNLVGGHFRQVVADPDEPDGDRSEIDAELLDVWLGMLERDRAVEVLCSRGLEQAEEVLDLIGDFRDSRVLVHVQAMGRERLDRLMPMLLEALAEQARGAETCRRLIRFLESVVRRSAYIALLVENPLALQQLVRLTSASPWIADQLATHPVLLDELLDVGTLYTPPDHDALDDELHQQMLRIPEDDLEQQMETLRTFKQAHLLRVAASDVTGTLPLMKVSDYLTWLAEAILGEVLRLAWSQMVARHGRPLREDGQPCDPDFVVIGYGKLGGIELSYNSDLDLVFLHDAARDGTTDGERPVPNEVFFARLGQRIIHILTVRTLGGELYEVDMRLRPSGTSGLLVSSMGAYQRYQEEQAWTWEHQALVRARVVAGCDRARARFDAIRHRVLARERDPGQLRAAVREMREKMIAHLGQSDPARFDLKNDAGGIVDIEFVVQYGALRWAFRHGELTRFTDNIRLLETLAALELMPAQDAALLREAYLAYRSAAHRLALRKESAVVEAEPYRELREGVRSIWQAWFDGDS